MRRAAVGGLVLPVLHHPSLELEAEQVEQPPILDVASQDVEQDGMVDVIARIDPEAAFRLLIVERPVKPDPAPSS